MPKANGKTTSNREADGEIQIPLEFICHDPQNRDAPCPICDGKGVIILDVPVDDPRYGKFQRCPNHPIEIDFDRHERLRRFGNLQAYKGKTFENFNTHHKGLSAEAVTSLNGARQAAVKFAEEAQGWLVYEGPYGCGKTHLAVAIANARLEQFGEQVLFITAPDLLDYLRTSFRPDAEIPYSESFDQIRNIPLLVLDDLGVENPSAWAKEKLFQLLNYRYVNELPTVITTNTPLDELDPRISSRMMVGRVVIHIKIKAPDYRKLTSSHDEYKHISNLHLYHRMRFETFLTNRPIPEEARNLQGALELARSWAAKPAQWLCFIGDFGSGKTHLAAAIANDLHDRKQEVIFTTIPELLDYLRLTFNPKSHVRFDKRFHEIMNAPILILDDLRLASATAWAKEKLFQIIDYRYLAKMPTVITSSETMDETDPRLATRLGDNRVCLVFALEVPSYVKRNPDIKRKRDKKKW